MNKEKKKQYLKNNIICFVIGTIIFGAIGIYAIVTFPSNEVSYDNKSSGLSSTNVKGAIDELYEACTTKTPAEEIIENAGLKKDSYECRYFFTGSNPNNYITFNNETAGWRIISVECDGTIKIMKVTSIGRQRWDESGNNNWTNASLNTYLNNDYYNNQINATAKNQIVASNFSIGNIEFGESNLLTQINKENAIKWNGKIALPTLSEYFRTNAVALTFSGYHAHYNSYKNYTWMYYGASDRWWTLTPNSAYNNSAYYILFSGASNGGRIYADYQSVRNKSLEIRPTIYISSNIKLSGSGTQLDPYTITN